MIQIAKNKFFNRYLPLALAVVILAVGIFSYLTIHHTTKTAEAGWYNNSWLYRKSFTIDHTKVSTASSTTLSLFPVLFNRTDVDLKTQTNGGGVASSTGADILFTSGDGVTKLPHEIETYASTTGQLIAWIQVPSVSPTVDTTLYIYYGNASAADQSNKTGVWDSNFKGVFHLPDGTTLAGTDSTSNANNGTVSNATAATGQVDGAGSFNGTTSYVESPASSSMDPTSGFTFSAWVNLNGTQTTDSAILSKIDYTNAYNGYMLWYTGSGGTVQLYVNNSGRISTTPATGSWVYIVGTWDGSTLTLYNNASVAGTAAYSTAPASSAQKFEIGRYLFSAARNITGSIDEVRISNVSRSIDWIKTEYNNQNSPSTFFNTYGSQQALPFNLAPWYNSSWGYRKQITISKSMVSTSSPLSNFPVEISIPSDPNLAYTGSGGKMGLSTGLDMLFTSADGVTKLSHEVESYSSTTGATIAWVNVPTLTNNADVVLYLYYGNASASDQSNKTSVWDSNFKGVWHLPNGTTLTANDSTGNANNASGLGSVTAIQGKIDGGASLPGNSQITVPRTASLEPTNMTVSMWVKGSGSASSMYLLSKLYSSVTSGSYAIYNGSSASDIYFYMGDGTGAFTRSPSGGNVWDNVWHYVTGTWDGTTASISVDGGVFSGTSAAKTIAYTTNNLYFGSFDGTQAYATASIDEVRVSNSLRSADWVKTEYNNQSNPPAYILVSGQQAYTAPTKVSNWYNSSWTNRRQITIDHNKVSQVNKTTLTNFPVLFNTTDTEFKTVANGGKVGLATGLDIVFTASDGTTKLNYEMEKYASTTGQTIAWVQVPQLSPTSDAIVYMYYGNASAADQSNKTGVWDGNYKRVWHMADNAASTTVVDSTATNNGTSANNTSGMAATAKIDGGFTMNGTSDNVKTGALTFSGATAAWTLSAWVKTTATNASVFGLRNSTTASPVMDLVVGNNGVNNSGTGKPSLIVRGDDSAGLTNINAATAVNDGTWHYLVASRDSSKNIAVYIDGASAVTGTDTLSSSVTIDANGGFLGYEVQNVGIPYLNGSMDEARVSFTNRSADWIATEYNNQNSPSTFYALGASGIENAGGGSSKFASRGSGTGWYATGGTWTNRKQITIDHNKISQVATTTFSSFPLLFSVTDSDLKYTGSGGKVGKSDGTDILFTSSDGTTKLDHELESYSSTTGATIAWVRIPTLSATSDTAIFVYYGNASSGDQSNKTGVWDSNYKAVYHLPNGTTLSATDSTSNANNGTNHSATATTGQIDGGAAFNGSTQYISAANAASLQVTSTLTVSAWVYVSALPGAFTEIARKGTPYFLLIQPNNKVWLATNNNYNDGGATGGVNLTTGWHYYVGTVTIGTPLTTMYLDGASGYTSASNTILPTGTEALGLGAIEDGSGQFLNGSLDEVRISGISRSADWIATEYANQSSPSTFYAYGASGVNGRQNAAGTPVPAIKARGGVKFH